MLGIFPLPPHWLEIYHLSLGRLRKNIKFSRNFPELCPWTLLGHFAPGLHWGTSVPDSLNQPPPLVYSTNTTLLVVQSCAFLEPFRRDPREWQTDRQTYKLSDSKCRAALRRGKRWQIRNKQLQENSWWHHNTWNYNDGYLTAAASSHRAKQVLAYWQYVLYTYHYYVVNLCL